MRNILWGLFILIIVASLSEKCGGTTEEKQIKAYRAQLIKEHKLPPKHPIEFGDRGWTSWVNRYEGGRVEYIDYIYVRWRDVETGEFKTLRCSRSSSRDSGPYLYGCRDAEFKAYSR